MNQTGMKAAACALAITVAAAGWNMKSDATAVSAALPVAGLTLTLKEGISLESIEESVQQTASVQASQENISENLLAGFLSGVQSGISLPKLPGSLAEAASVQTTKQLEDISVSANDPVLEPELPEETETADEDATAPAETETQGSSDEAVETESETESVEETETETSEEESFKSLVIAKVNDYVNVRNMPSEEGEIVGKLYDKSVGTFLSEKDGWYEINSGKVTGYVKAEYCVTGDAAVELAKQVGTRMAVVTTTTLKVRQEPGLDAPVLGLIPIEDELVVLEELDGWVKVNIEEGDGYVSMDYVSLRTDFVQAESKEEEEARLKQEEEAREAARKAAKEAVAKREAKQNEQKQNGDAPKSQVNEEPVVTSGGSAAGSAVASYATQFVGNPYVYGGSSLTNGTDCSGFVMSVYANYGVNLPHSSAALRSKGSNVGGLGNAQPGDIVCYSGHVGIYIGNGQIVHASTAKTGIIVSNANYRNVLAVRRIF